MPDLLTTQDISNAISDALLTHYTIAPETHEDHHEWIKLKMEAENERIKTYKEIRKTVMQWSVVAILTSITASLNFDKIVGLFRH